MLDDKEPCFLVIVKDQGFLLLGYTPDAASVKDRMTYSSSKGSLKALVTILSLADVLRLR